uniref:Uncharacterized protein n=1 Tax=Elaeophora elaphi TaxID=1147741 RepID=A0A0R3RIF5_9BILA
MSIHTIPYRIVAKRLGGIVPSTSGRIILNLLPVTRYKNFGDRRNFSSGVHFSIAAELRALPTVQWFERSIKASCSYAQDLIENSGLSSTPLEHLGLYTWWKPSSWYRVFLEYLHTNYDLSWLATVIFGTLIIRVATLYLPVLIFWKRTKFEKAILPFLHRIQSRVGSIVLYSSSVGVSFTQYCGLKQMAEVVYPTWTTSGLLSFTDLTVSDPNFFLPTLTAICFTFASKKWIETLQMQKTVSHWMIGLKPNDTIYPIAACSFFVANNVPSIVCVYWITSSLISSVHATVLRAGAVRFLLHLPGVCSDPTETRRIELLNYVSEMRRSKASETLEVQKRIAEIKQKSDEDKISKSLVKDAENTEFEKDSLFREPWREDAALLSSRIAKLMEQRLQEAAQESVITKTGKPNSVIRTNSRKFEVDKITAG